MPLTVERKLPLILFFVVAVLTGLGVVLYQYTASLQDTVDIEKRTQKAISKLDETLRLTLDVESAVSSFVITGNDTYLDPYRRARTRVPQNIAELRIIATDLHAESGDIDQLEKWTAEMITQAEKKIERRKIEGFEATITSVGNASERAVNLNIRALIDRIKATELAALEQREAKLEESFYRTIWVLIIGCVAGVVALGMANLVVSREIVKRRRAEGALTDANRDLETRIQERTEQLEQVNRSLRAAADEREVLLKSEQDARREAEIANRLRDEFMATVSHELKTPLNSILGWARMLKTGDLNESQVKKALGTIIKNSETQNRLIEDLLDVARIISGKLVPEFEPIDAFELLHDAIEIVRPSANAKRLSITQQTDPEADGSVIRGDRNRLLQVFSNLLTNAVKFTPEDGAIEASMSRESSEIAIRVRDNGIGISEEFLPVVFERFRQETPAKAGNGGLGLGLAIVRHLIEMHGGSVSVASQGLGHGSEFTVRLPLQQQEGSRQ